MRRRGRQLLILIGVLVLIAGAAIYVKYNNGNIIYLTTGLRDSTFFKVKDKKGSKAEVEILSADVKAQYQKVFGADIWKQTIDGVSFEKNARNMIKTKLLRVKNMNILAEEKGVVLDRDQKANVEKAAADYMAGLTPEQRTQMGITDDDVKKMFEEFAIAKILYQDMTNGLVSEISTDQARVIKIQYIYADTLEKIQQAKNRIDGGDSFYSIAKDIEGSSETYEYELKRGEMEKNFEDVAFNLKAGQVSDVISQNGKYYIIKCISDNEKTKTESNKKRLEASQKLDSFNKIFEQYEADNFVYFNKKAWKKFKISDAPDISVYFEDIFNQYFNS